MESPYNVMMSEFVFGFDAAQMLLTHGDVGGCSGFCLMAKNPHTRSSQRSSLLAIHVNAIHVLCSIV
jgi:hypothetical protein